jgi:hypothetical protein
MRNPRTPTKRPNSPTKAEKSLVFEWQKTVVVAVTTGTLAYIGGLVLPPTAVYDRIFRQDPNNFTGTWRGAVDGAPAEMSLREVGVLQVEGTLRIADPAGPKSIVIKGSHDSRVSLQGPWGDGRVLKMAFVRIVPDRSGADRDILILRGDGEAKTARLCPPNSSVLDCRELGDTWFAKLPKR